MTKKAATNVLELISKTKALRKCFNQKKLGQVQLQVVPTLEWAIQVQGISIVKRGAQEHLRVVKCLIASLFRITLKF